VQSLLSGILSEKLKFGRRQNSSSYSKRKLADHKLEEKKGVMRIVRRHCAGCYEKIRQEQSRGPNMTAAKKIKTFF
jgi:hypothetical protein